MIILQQNFIEYFTSGSCTDFFPYFFTFILVFSSLIFYPKITDLSFMVSVKVIHLYLLSSHPFLSHLYFFTFQVLPPIFLFMLCVIYQLQKNKSIIVQRFI